MNPEFLEITPAPACLAPFVRRFFYANRELAAPIPITPKPTGYHYFSHFLSQESAASVRYILDGRRLYQLSRWNLAGQITDVEIRGLAERELRVLFCELSPTAPHRLYGIPADWLTNEVVPMAEIEPTGARSLESSFALGTDASMAEHLAETVDYFQRLIPTAKSADPDVEAVIARFEEENGLVRVSDLCAELGISRRHLSRKFHQQVGIAPKFFGQVLQINWAVGLLYSGDDESLTDVAQSAGFFDQAHFVHAMQRFFTASPREFLHGDDISLRTFLATSRFAQER